MPDHDSPCTRPEASSAGGVTDPALPRRALPGRRAVWKLSVTFNGETLQGYVLAIDARSAQERDVDAMRKAPAGPVVVFFPGHAQRPGDAPGFTLSLARGSSSGIVVVPVCDTPYGIDRTLRGDAGKEAVLMAIVRHACGRLGVMVNDGGAPGQAVIVEDGGGHAPGESMHARLAVVGWSHGALLARRFAHAYRDAVVCLGQVCPAGYARWGGLELAGRFVRESLGMARREHAQWPQLARSAWGFTRGMCGDLARSVAGAVRERMPAKLLRVFRDIEDCTVFCQSPSFCASHLDRIAVIFARDDTCMSPARLLGCDPVLGVSERDIERFRERFFSDVTDPARIRLRILPGTHAAPVTHPGLYAAALLEDMGCAVRAGSEGEGA